MEQQLAQMMATQQRFEQQMQAMQLNHQQQLQEAQQARQAAQEELKVSHERTEKLSGREGQKKKQSRSS
jgi:hypothetical protein